MSIVKSNHLILAVLLATGSFASGMDQTKKIAKAECTLAQEIEKRNHALAETYLNIYRQFNVEYYFSGGDNKEQQELALSNFAARIKRATSDE